MYCKKFVNIIKVTTFVLHRIRVRLSGLCSLGSDAVLYIVATEGNTLRSLALKVVGSADGGALQFRRISNLNSFKFGLVVLV